MDAEQIDAMLVEARRVARKEERERIANIIQSEMPSRYGALEYLRKLSQALKGEQ